MSDLQELAERLDKYAQKATKGGSWTCYPSMATSEAEAIAAALRRVARLEEALRDLLHYSDEAGGARNSEEAAVRCAAREALK